MISPSGFWSEWDEAMGRYDRQAEAGSCRLAQVDRLLSPWSWWRWRWSSWWWWRWGWWTWWGWSIWSPSRNSRLAQISFHPDRCHGDDGGGRGEYLWQVWIFVQKIDGFLKKRVNVCRDKIRQINVQKNADLAEVGTPKLWCFVIFPILKFLDNCIAICI